MGASTIEFTPRNIQINGIKVGNSKAQESNPSDKKDNFLNSPALSQKHSSGNSHQDSQTKNTKEIEIAGL